MLVALDHALLQHGEVPAFAVSAAAVAMHVMLVAPSVWLSAPLGPVVGLGAGRALAGREWQGGG